MSGASLFVGNDSGPAHMAAAFGVPVVVLFGPSNPVTWAPWRTAAQVMTAREDIARDSVDTRCSRRRKIFGLTQGEGMNELSRLLRYSRPYTPHLVLSVILMACVGAAQALTALLIGPIFDRVLNPSSADTPVMLLTIPIIKRPVLLSELLPSSIHNVWTMVAVAILAVFPSRDCAITSRII